MRRIFWLILGAVFTCLPTLSAQENPENGWFAVDYPHTFSLNVPASTEKTSNGTVSKIQYAAADGKLAVNVTLKTFDGFPVKEIRTSLTNLSQTEETEVLSNFRVFTHSCPLEAKDSSARIHALLGSHCQPDDFSPHEQTLSAGEKCSFSTPSGRSSNEFMPYIETSVNEKNGALYAIGWTGSWKADFTNEAGSLKTEIGMLRSHFKLLPGETILQPSVLVFERKGLTRREFKTVVHRFMRECICPRARDGKIVPPILALTAGGGNKTPRMMLDVLQYSLDAKLPFDTFWVDAGWYGPPHQTENYSNCGPNWWKYVGDWRVNTVTHPTGDLLPIANAVHQAGMRFLLWFEPERIRPESPILKEHPEYARGELFDYSNPEALKYMQDTIYGIIEKHGVDIYRQDFNMNPAGEWNAGEAPERQGITEARHVAALYQFMDQMRERFPDILQENCASGGRRIDFEMAKRAHSYCRTDYAIGKKPGDTAFILGQNMTLNTLAYLPFQGSETNCVDVGDDYAFMSVISSGTVFTPTDFDGGIVRRKFSDAETQWFQKMFGLTRRLMQYYLGDFYPLCGETSTNDDIWCGWSMHRPNQNDGFVLIFRRAQAPEETKTFELSAIDPTAEYDVELFDGTKKILSGKELASLKVSIPKRSFFLLIYQKKQTEKD